MPIVLKNNYTYQYFSIYQLVGVSLLALIIKNLPQMQEPKFDSWVVTLEKGIAAHSNILAWRIPWTEETGRLQSTGRLQ